MALLLMSRVVLNRIRNWKRIRVEYGNTEWFQWLAIPPRNAALWPTLPQRENLDTLVFWRKVNVPVLLVYGEKDEIAPVDQSIEAIKDAVNGRVSFTAVIAPGAQHNLTIQPTAEWTVLLVESCSRYRRPCRELGPRAACALRTLLVSDVDPFLFEGLLSRKFRK